MDKPIIVITGPTASGKTGLALELAKKYNGEIICADSRTVYKGMDIGTAKPTRAEQAMVAHHLLDVVEPGERFTAQDFQQLAFDAIKGIQAHGRTPFLVGGTGLYIDAVTLEFDWPTVQKVDAGLDKKSVQELQAMIKEQHKKMPENPLNKRHLLNVLKRESSGTRRASPRENVTVVAIATDKDVLEGRIQKRAREMFDTGVIDEAKWLGDLYGWGSEAMRSNIYPIIKKVLDGELTKEQAVEQFITRDRQLAKRQITWLKRHDYVKWLSLDDARSYLQTVLE
jgi:tRNA dimethylallyltransferase